MKLERVLEQLNSFEKNAFIKILDSLISSTGLSGKEIENVLSGKSSNGLKDADNREVSLVFNLVKEAFKNHIIKEFNNTESQIDILIDILIRDGNSIMKNVWFSKLYESEIKHIQKEVKTLKEQIEAEKSEIENQRKRDYNIYLNCLKVSYNNDFANNRDKKISQDEQSILNALRESLELSQEEVKKINYLVIPIVKQDIDLIINDLKNIGVIFFSKKTNIIYVPDEIVEILRKIRNKDLSDKHFRRVLRSLKEPQINLICRKHNLDVKQGLDDKIRSIINGGLNFKKVLIDDIHKEPLSVTEKKKWLNDFWGNSLKIAAPLKGSTLEDKINSIIEFFEDLNNDERIGISLDGYNRLINDLDSSVAGFRLIFLKEFQLEDDFQLSGEGLINYNIKPRDVLDILNQSSLQSFINSVGAKSRGSLLDNILEFYTDTQNLFLEGYVDIANRDLHSIKERGLKIKEAELGLIFEALTKQLFQELGFNVDEELRKTLNTAKDKIDILINLGEKNLILVECKTSKDQGYNKFSAVSRQLISYKKVAMTNGYSIIKTLLIAPDFSDDFINDTNSEMELNLSLISALSLKQIRDYFKANKRHSSFPYILFMKDVVIQPERVIKALAK
ncbi:MAG: hypothetical protein FJZ75_07470 [Bacteroidetes bacterium]|nr:hypothetical protein [Bacteroidota bacterium]